MSDLPKGWVKASLETLIQPKSERVSPAEHAQARYIGLEHVEAHTNSLLDIAHASSVRSSSAVFVSGDVLYGRMRPYLNKVVRPNFGGLASAEFIVLPENPALDSDFLLKRISSSDFVQFACSQYEGDRPRVKFDQLGKFLIDLPPRAEQTRIVAKLEELLSDLDAGVAELKAAQKKLQQYRQSLLKAAVEGALTADWRDAQRQLGTLTETGAQLLARLLAERRARWEASQLVNFKEQGKVLPKDWQKKYPKPEKPSSADLPELPEGWFYADLETFIGPDKTGTKTGPFGSLLKKHEHRNSGIPVIGIENIAESGFVRGSKIHISCEKANDLCEYDLIQGDVVISRSGTVGEVCVIPGDLGEARFSTNIMRVRLNKDVMHPEFFCSIFRGSPFVLRQISELCSGSTRDFLNTEILKSLTFAIPPIKEQHEILAALHTRFAEAELLTGELRLTYKKSVAQRQNTLRAAFAGQIVSQDPIEEPAGTLLERIRADRTERVTNQTRARPRTSPRPD